MSKLGPKRQRVRATDRLKLRRLSRPAARSTSPGRCENHVPKKIVEALLDRAK